MTEPKHIRLLGSRSRIVLDDGAVTEILSNHWTMPGCSPGKDRGGAVGPSGRDSLHEASAGEELRFARNSPLEEEGFEPSVPPA
jgi:hypothetical protein